ncbi:alpha/beta fold hydrolase [Pseudonocardiaceae bacterium YIM PH 21723]|nr:alpha/beta fold hydrolase [Pseudonocardiaceae bacterium YIM PH 21723]
MLIKSILTVALTAGLLSTSDTPQWTSCTIDGTQAECATVQVPLDYRRPLGRTVGIAITRFAATDRAHRVGSLLVNIGGPGEPSRDAPLELSKRVRERFDVIGIDPRGVGESIGLDCGWTSGDVWYGPGLSRADFDRQVAMKRKRAAQCPGELLSHLSTRNAARDMDRIRAALGERKISYMGWSYGTLLGAVYSELFPGRVDRMVFDGVTNWRDSGTYYGRHAPMTYNGLREWADWAAHRDSTYHLGATVDEVLRRVESLASKDFQIDKYTVDRLLVPQLIHVLLNNSADDAGLAEGLNYLIAMAEGKPNPPGGERLKAAVDWFHSIQAARQATAQTAILCADVVEPSTVDSVWERIEAGRDRYGFIGAVTEDLTPCAFWPRMNREPVVRPHNDSAALMIAATKDHQALYSDALQTHRELPNSRLITLNSRQHTVYGHSAMPNAQVSGMVDDYLLTGVLPPRDITVG